MLILRAVASDPYPDGVSDVSGIASGTLIFTSELSDGEGLEDIVVGDSVYSFTVNKEGVYDIEFEVQDVAGNSSTESTEVKIDKTIPTVNYKLNTYNSDILSIKELNAYDNDGGDDDHSQSGINDETWEYYITDGTNSYGWTAFEWDDSEFGNDFDLYIDESGLNLSEGEYDLYVRIKDIASNLSIDTPEGGYPFIRDTEGPIVSGPAFGLSETVTAFKTTLLLDVPEAEDSVAGINNASWEYSFDNLTWLELDIDSAINDLIDIAVPEELAEGENTLYLRVCDNAGNQSEAVSGIFIVDRTAPEISDAEVKIYYMEEASKVYLDAGGFIGKVVPYIELNGTWSDDVTQFSLCHIQYIKL